MPMIFCGTNEIVINAYDFLWNKADLFDQILSAKYSSLSPLTLYCVDTRFNASITDSF